MRRRGGCRKSRLFGETGRARRPAPTTSLRNTVRRGNLCRVFLKSHVFDTALGQLGIAWRNDRICALQLPLEKGQGTTQAICAAMRAPPPEQTIPRVIKKTVERIQRHLDGHSDPMRDVLIDVNAKPPFTRRVLEWARTIEPGQTCTYGELATRCGSPGASRAVGQIMARNPIPILIPCHRIVGAGGKLTGFSAAGGVSTKLRMLTIEGFDELRFRRHGG